jgi:integrating conjugative element protein (TIGR03759 family)
MSQLTPTVYSQLTTDQQKTVADMWHLSVSDYTRYLSLMSNSVNAIYYKDRNLDPSWILGFNAKDETERQKYVVIAIQNERERIEKELAFQRDFTQLQKNLFPDQAPIVWKPEKP